MRLAASIGGVCLTGVIGGAVVALLCSFLSLPDDMPPSRPPDITETISFVGLAVCLVGAVVLCISQLVGNSGVTPERPNTNELQYCQIIAALLNTRSTPQMMPPELMRDAEMARDKWHMHGMCKTCGREMKQ